MELLNLQYNGICALFKGFVSLEAVFDLSTT